MRNADDRESQINNVSLGRILTNIPVTIYFGKEEMTLGGM